MLWYDPEVNLLNKIWKNGAMWDTYSQVSAHKGDRDQRKDDKDQFQISTSQISMWTSRENITATLDTLLQTWSEQGPLRSARKQQGSISNIIPPFGCHQALNPSQGAQSSSGPTRAHRRLKLRLAKHSNCTDAVSDYNSFYPTTYQQNQNNYSCTTRIW